MANRLNITIVAENLASREFRRVARDSERLAARIDHALGNVPSNLNKDFRAMDRNTQKTVNNMAEGFETFSQKASDSIKQTSDNAQKVTDDMGKNFHKTLGDMRADAEKGINVEVGAKTGEAFREVEAFKKFVGHLPPVVQKFTTQGAEKVMEVLDSIDLKVARTATRGAIIEVGERGARETLKTLLGLQGASFALAVKKSIMEVGTRGAVVVLKTLLDIREAKAAAEGKTVIESIIEDAANTMEQLRHIKDETQNVDGTYARIKTILDGAKEVIKNLFTVHKDAQDVADEGIKFTTWFDDSDDIVGKTQETNDDANDISQHTIKFLTKLLGEKELLTDVQELEDQAEKTADIDLLIRANTKELRRTMSKFGHAVEVIPVDVELDDISTLPLMKLKRDVSKVASEMKVMMRAVITFDQLTKDANTFFLGVKKGTQEEHRLNIEIDGAVRNLNTLADYVDKVDENVKEVAAQDLDINFDINQEEMKVVTEAIRKRLVDLTQQPREIEFGTTIVGEEEVVERTKEINTAANRISQGTITFLTDLLDKVGILKETKILEKAANTPRNIIDFLFKTEGTEEVERKAFSLKHMFAVIGRSPVVVGVTMTGAIMAMKNLHELDRTMAELGQTTIEVAVGTAAVTLGSQAVSKLIGLHRDLQGEIKDTAQKLVELDGIDPEIAVKMANKGSVLAYLKKVNNEVKNLSKKRILITAGIVGGGIAIGMLRNLRREAENIDRQEAKIQVSVDGFLKTMSELALLRGAITWLNQNKARIGIDASGAILLPKLLGDSLAILQHFQTVGAAIHAVMVPTMIGAFGALAAGVGQAAAAVMNLGSELAPALVGALGSVGGAVTLGAAGVAAYGMAIQRTISFSQNLTATLYSQYREIKNSGYALESANTYLKSTTKGTQEYEDAVRGVTTATSQQKQEVAKFGAMLRSIGPEQIKLGKNLNKLELGMIAFSGAIREKVSPALNTMVNIFRGRFKQMQSPILDFIGDMNKVAVSLVKTGNSGQQLKSITTILQGIGAAGPKGLNMVGQALLALLNVIQAVVPNAVKVAGAMEAAAVAARKWTASAKGQETIAAVWADMSNKASLLWKILGNLARVVQHVWQAFSGSDANTGGVLQSINEMTARWSSFTAAGTRGGQMLRNFFNAAQPVLMAAGSLLKAVVQEVVRVAYVIGTTGQSAGKLNPMVDVLQHIQNVIRPIGNLIIGNFQSLAPRIGPMLEILGKLGSVFLASIPPLEFFIDTFNKIFAPFVALDSGIQRKIAGFLSWGAVLMMLGRGPLAIILGAISKFAAVLVGPLALAIRTASGVARPFMAGLLKLVAVFAGPMMRITGFSAILMALTGPIGIVVIALGALAVAAAGIIANWDKLTAYFSGGGQSMWEGISAKIRSFAQDALGFLQQKAQAAVTWFKANWPAIQNTIVTVANIIWSKAVPIFKTVGSVIMGAFRGIMSILPNIGRTFTNLAVQLGGSLGPSLLNIVNGFRAMLPIVRPLGALVGGLLIGAFKALWPLVSIVAKVMGGILLFAFKAATWAFLNVGRAIGFVGKILTPFIPAIKVLGLVIGYVFATVIAGAVGKVIQGFALIATKVFPVLLKLSPLVAKLSPIFKTLWTVTKLVYSGFKGMMGILGIVLAKLGGFGKVIASVILAMQRGFAKGKVIGAVQGGLQQILKLFGGLGSKLVSLVTKTLGLIIKKFKMTQVGKAVMFLVNQAVKMFNRLPAGVGRALSSVRATISSTVSLWVIIFKRNLGVISSAVKMGFQVIGRVISVVIKGVQLIIRGAWNIIKGIFTGNMKTIKIGMMQWSGGVRVIIKALVGGIKALFTIAWRAITFIWKNNLDGIRATLAGWGKSVNKIWSGLWKWLTTLIKTTLIKVIRTIAGWAVKARKTFDSFISGLRKLWDSFWKWYFTLIRGALSKVMNAIEGWIGRQKKIYSEIISWLKKLWNVFWDWYSTLVRNALSKAITVLSGWIERQKKIYSDIASWLKKLWTGLWNLVNKVLDGALNKANSRIQEWWGWAKGTFNTIKNSVKSAFELIGKAIWQPIEGAFGKLKSVWNSILNFIAGALEKIGAKDAAEKVRKAKFGMGGKTGGGGGSSGGSGRGAGMTGGFGFAEGGRAPHYVNNTTYMYGEKLGAGQREYFLTEHPSFKNRNEKLWSEYGSRQGFLRDGRSSQSRSHRTPKGGGWGQGEALGPTLPDSHLNKDIRDRATSIARQTGTSFNTYVGHGKPGGSTSDYTVDFWGLGGRGAQINKEAGFKTAELAINDYNSNPGVLYIIRQGEYWRGGNWTGNTYGDPHYDHTHVSWDSPTGARHDSGGGSGSGGGLLPSLQEAFIMGWDATIQKWIENKVDFGNQSGLATGAETFVEGTVFGGVRDKIASWLPGGSSGSSSGGAGGSGLGGTPSKNRELGKEMNAAKGWDKYWSSLDKLWMKESSWNHLADNPSSAAYGIPQAMTSAHNMPKGYGPPGGDPKVQIDWGLNYIKGRYGNPGSAWQHSQNMNWYRRGGQIPGPRGVHRPAMVAGGEAVLPANTYQAIESLAAALRKARTATHRGMGIESLGRVLGGSEGANRPHRRDDGGGRSTSRVTNTNYSSNDTYEIHVHATKGMDEDKLAKAVTRELERRDKKKKQGATLRVRRGGNDRRNI